MWEIMVRDTKNKDDNVEDLKVLQFETFENPANWNRQHIPA